MRRLAEAEWRALAEKLYGPDPKLWTFVCPACGHEQSGAGVYARNPGLERRRDAILASGLPLKACEAVVSSWIYFSCEGRTNPNVGCDWTLGGLFKIHRLEVVAEDGAALPVFELADDPDRERKPDGISKRNTVSPC